MKTEYKQYIITTPDNFQKVPLPGFQAWYDALMKNPPQGKGQLCKVEKGIRKYCCLGVLCETQGRLNKKDVFGIKYQYGKIHQKILYFALVRSSEVRSHTLECRE